MVISAKTAIMIKLMINQKESKQVRIDSWLFQSLSQDMKTKTKNKDQPTNNHKK